MDFKQSFPFIYINVYTQINLTLFAKGGAKVAVCGDGSLIVAICDADFILLPIGGSCRIETHFFAVPLFAI